MTQQSFLNSLNPQQLLAVSHVHGPILVLAGAGTGKTKVLMTRIANIIQQGLTLPQNILAFTFINKAAREMQDRINKMIDCYGLNIGTFHSIAARILRQQAEHLNFSLNSRFTIISADDQLKLVKDIVKQKILILKNMFPNFYILLFCVGQIKDYCRINFLNLILSYQFIKWLNLSMTNISKIY